jgi:hypothetical protein
MTPHERVITYDNTALTALDIHHGMLLGCPTSDLRRPSWHILVSRPDSDPTALLFGRRTLLHLVSPTLSADERADEHVGGGVALVSPELHAPLAALLRQTPPRALFQPAGLAQLDALVRGLAGSEITARATAHQQLRYTFAGAFQPYLGQWLEWIEPLDEAREMDPIGLGLLARFGRGVFVVRQAGVIVGYSGLRQQSAHVWDLTARTLAEPLLGHGLGRALISRATRAALAESRLPLASHPASDTAARHIAQALGYRLYGQAIVYTGAA